MIAGMSTSSFFGRDLLENNIDHMAKMGVKTAEVYLNTFSEFEAPYVKELKKRIDDNGMTVHSVHPHGTVYELQFYSNYVRSMADAEGWFRKVQEAAGILGADLTVYHGGFPIKKPGTRPNIERIAKVVTKCAEIAKSYGVKFAHENVYWAWFSDPYFADALLENVESDNLYFTMDIKQAAQSGYCYNEYIEHMKGRIVNVHCCDYVKNENGFATMLPPRGSVDFRKLKDDLRKSGYDGPMMMEVYPTDYNDFSELEESYRIFKDMIED